MVETRTVVDKLRVTYEGIFSMHELHAVIDNWLREKGYDKMEKKNVEKVTPKGKDIELLLQPWKKITDYAKIILNIRLIATGITEVEIEKDGTKVKMNQGSVQLSFDGWLVTDYENRWEGKPIFFFLRQLFDRYVFKPYTMGYENAVAKDAGDIYGEVKAFLNLYQYR